MSHNCEDGHPGSHVIQIIPGTGWVVDFPMAGGTDQYNDLQRLFASLDGTKVPGGCDHCNAYQNVDSLDTHGTAHISVHHDDWCSWWTAHRRASRG